MTNRFKLASRKLISIVAIVAMVITSISFISVQNNAYAASKTAQVGGYIVAVPNGASLNDANASTEVTKLDPSGSNTLAEGWYVFEGMNDFNNGIVIEGDCNIILADGCHVSVTGSEGNAGIQVSNGASLTIWSGSQKTGMLTAEGGKFAAGIGGSNESKTRDGSNITINGGNIVAYGGNGGAGIGGGANGNGYNIRINDGYVLCYAENAYAIGGGFNGKASNIVISKSRLVRAGTTEAKATVINNNGSDLSDKIANKTLMKFVSVDDYTGNSGEKNTSESGTVNNANRVGAYVVAVPDGVTLPDNVSKSTEVKTIDSASTTLTTGWYAADDDVTIDDRIQIQGDVNIILTDNNKVMANKGIQVSDNNSLTIWSEMGGTGELEATGGYRAAGIGGDDNNGDGSNITINGGIINAKSESYGAGIGGGNFGPGHNITINGGTVTAQGGCLASGIGGGDAYSGYDIIINGGSVSAEGAQSGAGIGGGSGGEGYRITINGGKVTTRGSLFDGYRYEEYCGAGIGGGTGCSGHDITINGGTVTAYGSDGDEKSAAGIGGGDNGSGYNITVEGGNVTAVGGYYALGIGAGYDGYGLASYSKIIISSSLHVEGRYHSDDTLTITSDNDDYSEHLVLEYYDEYDQYYFDALTYIHIYPKDEWNNQTVTTPETTTKSLKGYKKSIKVTWATRTDVDGYQILYKTTKSKTNKYKIVTVKSATTATKTIKNLKRNKRYYFKIRTYAGTTSNHSDWSKLKSIKTK